MQLLLKQRTFELFRCEKCEKYGYFARVWGQSQRLWALARGVGSALLARRASRYIARCWRATLRAAGALRLRAAGALRFNPLFARPPFRFFLLFFPLAFSFPQFFSSPSVHLPFFLSFFVKWHRFKVKTKFQRSYLDPQKADIE